MRLVAKFYVTHIEQWATSRQLHLQAVCRGEENSEWASATPSGSLTISADLAPAALEAFESTIQGGAEPEVFVYSQPDRDGDWELKTASFVYADGIHVVFERVRSNGDFRGGKFEMTVKNTEATRHLMDAFAQALLLGKPSRFNVWTEAITS